MHIDLESVLVIAVGPRRRQHRHQTIGPYAPIAAADIQYIDMQLNAIQCSIANQMPECQIRFSGHTLRVNVIFWHFTCAISGILKAIRCCDGASFGWRL